MSQKLYVGNLSWNLKDEDLRRIFGEFGEVEDAFVMKDRNTGRSKGFGFVTFTNEEDAQKAITALHGKEMDGRAVTVDVARPPKPRTEGSFARQF